MFRAFAIACILLTAGCSNTKTGEGESPLLTSTPVEVEENCFDRPGEIELDRRYSVAYIYSKPDRASSRLGKLVSGDVVGICGQEVSGFRRIQFRDMMGWIVIR